MTTRHYKLSHDAALQTACSGRACRTRPAPLQGAFSKFSYDTEESTADEDAGPHYILDVMLLEYLERLEGTVFVTADRVVKISTVVVLQMLAIKYNDDEAPKNSFFNDMIRTVQSMSDMTLDEIGMQFSEPPLKEDRFETPIPRDVSVAEQYLDATTKQEIAYLSMEASVMLVNGKLLKNLHKQLTLIALIDLEIKVLKALD